MDIIIENRQFRLVIGEDCIAKSLIHKATGEECLQLDELVSFFTLTQDRPFNNEIKLAFCNKRTTFEGNSLRQEGNKLIVGFDKVLFEAVVEVKITDSYASFCLVDYIIPPEAFRRLCMTPPPVSEFRLINLHLKKRTNFGQWLNVMWDDAVAVNVLATSPYEKIDSEKRPQSRILTADAVRGIKVKGCCAALIVTSPQELLDHIDVLECDYDMPHGARSRKSEFINASSYWVSDLNPDTVDTHIAICKQAGLKLMLIYYKSLFVEEAHYWNCGDYDLRECFGGLEGLKKVIGKIRDAGIIPGFHFLHSHIGINSRYVSPVADPRLNHTMHLALSKALGKEDTTVYVDREPWSAPMHPKCRVLQFGGELISYESFSAEPPYRFEGCKRGYYNTIATEHPYGTIGGILDISEFGSGSSVYIDQHTDLQDEVARKLAEVYNCGFEFVYYDGSEGVNTPYEFHVPYAQYRVYKLLNKEPLFCEGAAKAHFGWHMLSGGNAFDMDSKALVPTEDKLKPMIAKYPLKQAPHTAKDFTRLNFGWWDYFADNQPDSFEYGTSHAAAWNCPIIMKGNLPNIAQNARKKDVLETIKLWETARSTHFLSEEHKIAIRDENKEFHLFQTKSGLALREYHEVQTTPQLRAFVFAHDGEAAAVIWHRTGNGELQIPLGENAYDYRDGYDGTLLNKKAVATGTVIVLENRCYLRTKLSTEQLTEALEQATFV